MPLKNPIYSKSVQPLYHLNKKYQQIIQEFSRFPRYQKRSNFWLDKVSLSEQKRGGDKHLFKKVYETGEQAL